jgi:hypothetical protein
VPGHHPLELSGVVEDVDQAEIGKRGYRHPGEAVEGIGDVVRMSEDAGCF